MQSNLTEAYSAVYNQELIDEEYEAIVEEIIAEEDVIEELVYEMLDEGFEAEEVEEIFEAILDEARVTMGRGGEAGSGRVTTGTGSSRAAKARLDDMKSKKRAAAVAKVKTAVKDAPGRAARAAARGTEKAEKAVAKKVKDAKQQSHIRLAKYASKRGLMPGAGLKTQSSKGRGELRKAVAKDVAGRAAAKAKEMKGKAVQKASSAAVKGYAAGRAAKQAAGDAVGRAKQSAKNLAARVGRAVADKKDKVKSAVKSGLGKVARKVADKAGAAASRLGEEVDTYDVILEYLCVEGYAETLEEAEAIMVHLDEETRTGIIEEVSAE